MKIDSSNNGNILQYQDSQPRTQQSDAGSAAPTQSMAPASGTTVNLSSFGSHVRSASASNSGDIDTAHVESVKAALRNGTYQIDSGKIADGMLQSSRETMQPASN